MNVKDSAKLISVLLFNVMLQTTDFLRLIACVCKHFSQFKIFFFVFPMFYYLCFNTPGSLNYGVHIMVDMCGAPTVEEFRHSFPSCCSVFPCERWCSWEKLCLSWHLSGFIASTSWICTDALNQTNKKRRNCEMLYDFYFRAMEDFVLNTQPCASMSIHRGKTPFRSQHKEK